MLKCLFLLSLPFILFSCASIPKNTDLPTQKIEVGAGPEDFALDTSLTYPRLLVSCSERRSGEPFGEIVEVNLETKATRVLPREGNPKDFPFRPHGIDLQKVDGKLYLYAISHDNEKNLHVIYQYLVEKDRLVFQDTISNPKYIISPNDLAVATSGEIYYSNDAGKRGSLAEQLFKLKRSTVGYHNPKTDEWRIAADKMVYANGVAVRNDKVYVSTTRSNRIFQFNKDKDGRLNDRKTLTKINGLDNLIFYGDYLITTSHPKVVAFLKHAKNADKKSPSLIHQVDLKTGISNIIFADDGYRVSASSTGLIYDGKLYIAQVFDPFILQVEMK